MTTKQLLRRLENPRWDFTKSFEVLDIGGYTYFRYEYSILTSLNCFFIATKPTYREKGYGDKLLKKVLELYPNISTTIEGEDKLRIQSWLVRHGFEWDTKTNQWVSQRVQPKWHEDKERWNTRYTKLQYT